MVLRRLAFLGLYALAGACGSVEVRQNDVRLQPNEQVVLANIRFDDQQWSCQDADFLADARARQAEWAEALRRGFERGRADSGLGLHSGPEVPLTLEVVDLDPGSGWQRNLLFASSGQGVVLVRATIEGRGALMAGGSIEDQDTHGTFHGILEDVGAAVAHGLVGR